MNQISQSIERALELRGISTETALRFGIYSADEHGAPSGTGNVIVFPFWEHGVSVNEKFRAPGKKFWQRSGGRRTFWNSDVLDDPALHSGHMPLIITEGEIDALTAIECGFPLTVSVPDGAPPEKRADKTDEPANGDDQHGKYEFLWNNRDRLKRIKRFIIAVDGDAPGQRLASELVRRLSAARCSFVSYPDGCKDISDVQQRFGSDAVVSLLNSAKPYPVRGLYRISDYPNAGPLPVYSSGWWTLDEHAKFFLGAFVVISGIPSHGKALAIDTPIPTPSGWSTMGELKEGDSVYDDDGHECRVLRCSEVMYGRPCFRMQFDDGSDVIADADHQWFTISEKARRSARLARKNDRIAQRPLKPHGIDQTQKRTFPSIVTTREIAGTLISQGKRNHQIPIAAIDGTPTVLPIDPYILGVWLGNGTTANGTITEFQAEVLSLIVGRGGSLKRQKAIGRHNVEGLKVKLRELGVLGNKHIPPEYHRAPKSDRIALLRGLMDTDGSCRKRDRVCEFTSVKRKLAEDVLDLARSLGLKATWIEGVAKLNGRVIGPKYRVCFIADFPVFTVLRKIDAQDLGHSRRFTNRVIVGCEEIPSVPVRCIEVDSQSRLFLATKSFIPTHNSTFVSNLLVNFAEHHGWTSAIYTPEMPIVPQMRDKLRRIKGRRGLASFSADDLTKIDRWLDRAFVFIDADPNSDDDEEFNLDWVLDKATDAVLRDGIKVLVIDPWNELEHARAGNESMTDYIGRSIRSIKRWAKTYQVIVIVVAHPTKDVGKDGAVRRPGLYDIEGSSHWANKADIGIIIDWPDYAIPQTVVDVKKIRFEECGGKGSVKLKFDRYSARYSTLDEEECNLV